ncbi:putative nucleic acid binding protein [Cinnamomum micranthum f. kanehirae]|uniref:Putative nucleic acid binding protein n=1 Tax=Cinnamomum micranthum f. kanehirae TaxID=337451 RepID=A0A3S3P382_9MAGN|nr:putative nucleic acid binding protein [Cinnamomum micranthum f. kanehirae]
MLEKPPPSLLTFFLALLFMALSSFLPTTSTPQKHHQPSSKRKRKQQQQHHKTPSSWEQIKGLLTCKQIEGSQVHDPSKNLVGYSKLSSSCNSICSFRDVVHGNTRVIHREENSPESSSVGQETGLLRRNPASTEPSRSIRSNGGYSSSSRGMHLRRLSGCYECHMIVDPSRFPSARTSISACSECGEVFTKAESLDAHQAVRHAVSELGPDDSGRNIVEIIFKSSWLKKDRPIFKIERILKVHNTQRTIARFEDYRDSVKARASAHYDRCAADGNELLRFHCTTLTCALGARGASTLCGSQPTCGVCTIIRHGFAGKEVRTTASSGRAHDCLHVAADEGRRAMLVCRVIAGRVRRVGSDDSVPGEEESVLGQGGTYDSVVGHAGIYSNLEELIVFNPRAILSCFVVIYRSVD